MSTAANSLTSKTILITGSTDGLGLQAAKRLFQQGHTVLIHGRSQNKLKDAARKIQKEVPDGGGGSLDSFCADLSKLSQVRQMTQAVRGKHSKIDVLINNAGVLKTPNPKAENGLDIRFMVNTVAPYLLTKDLLDLIPKDTGRVVNLSSAAQAPINLRALRDPSLNFDDMDAYSQSKRGIIMWTNHLVTEQQKEEGAVGPMMVSLNPGSLLATKMVKEGFSYSGNDINIGINIMMDAALGDRFADASGKYYDNDSHRFAPNTANNAEENAKLVKEMDRLITTELSGNDGEL